LFRRVEPLLYVISFDVEVPGFKPLDR